MAYKNQIKLINKALRQVANANRTASYRAMNKAVNKTKTQFRRDVAAATKVKQKELSKRLFTQKATKLKPFNGAVTFGTHYDLPVHLFRPRTKQVKIGKGKSARKYKGVTIQNPNTGSRELVEGGFIWTRGSKKLVLKRKNKSRKPLTLPKLSIHALVQQQKKPMQNFMASEFEKNFNSQVQYEIGKIKI